MAIHISDGFAYHDGVCTLGEIYDRLGGDLFGAGLSKPRFIKIVRVSQKPSSGRLLSSTIHFPVLERTREGRNSA